MRTFLLTMSGVVMAALLPAAAHAAGVLDLMRYLPSRETVTEADAVKTAAVLLGERKQAMELAPCEVRLRAAKVLTPDDSYDPDRSLRKGFASMLFARGMGLKGGWAGRLTGRLGPRLAYKELEFLKLVPPLGTQDLMTGAELLALLKHAQDHTRAEALEKQNIRAFRKKEKKRRGNGR